MRVEDRNAQSKADRLAEHRREGRGGWQGWRAEARGVLRNTGGLYTDGVGAAGQG